MRLFSRIFRRCAHGHIRCVHGDEINNAGGRRRACLDCGRYLKGPLPPRCYVTGSLHSNQVEIKNANEYL